MWLAYLATRRDTFIIPTTNCLGYLTNSRLDAGVDPNRDFAYLRQDDKCFLSSTANVVVELFRRTIIQVPRQTSSRQLIMSRVLSPSTGVQRPLDMSGDPSTIQNPTTSVQVCSESSHTLKG